MRANEIDRAVVCEHKPSPEQYLRTTVERGTIFNYYMCEKCGEQFKINQSVWIDPLFEGRMWF